MNAYQITRITLNTLVVFLSGLQLGDVLPQPWGAVSTMVAGSLSLALRAAIAELPRDRVD